MDLFEKCKGFYSDPAVAQKYGYPTNPRTAQAMGLFPFFIPIDRAEGPEAYIHGKKYIMIGSNNYDGLTNHPKVKEAAIEAVRKYGTSCTGSRFLNGTLDLHIELEGRLAKYVGKEAALVFSTGFQVNLGSIPAIMDRDDIIITDKEVHASIIDGVRMAKSLKNVTVRTYKHNNPADLESVLKALPAGPAKLVIVDGVFSMGGDIAKLSEIIPLCKKYGARFMSDDAHAIGVLGRGRGTGWHFGLQDDVDLVMGTFSKSLASVGGFIAGPKEAVHFIQMFARPFMFSASLPPSNVATVLACLDILEAEPERVERVNKIADRVRTELRGMGYNIGASQTPIIPIVIGDAMKTLEAWNVFFQAGIYTNVALPPSVPPEFSCLRTSYMATHTDEQVDKVLEVFKKVKPLVQIAA
ncbi:MAG TPA: pyridoxal phosphate-dependent aminotransferase family protein [Candidatus Aminicenantes bacterium]|nr:pyridoxal phosphate-dependent aminotransferase family protein [Candidatus Aminicenantes bacterium]HRY63729.1 pyridoxal phosphate-dependent aminotransferase family protein [Candidatus Aminicenantes bacterium]HRZ70642.1 pyridoxal phosphate-dependent aminotransferase family protein [Candidatus Aminicenantes bacterium]